MPTINKIQVSDHKTSDCVSEYTINIQKQQTQPNLERATENFLEMTHKQQLFADGYGLLIGVGADLPVTVEDATALRNVLVDPARAAYPPGQVTLLTQKSATRQQIFAAFDRLIEQVNKNPQATTIIYYSGHGGYFKETSEYFLVPYGYNKKQQSDTAISGLEFTEKIEAIQAQKLIVFLDCCHAGGVPALKDSDATFAKSPVPQELLDALGSGSGRVVVASSREDEKSWTGNPYSIFTACLLEALQGQAATHQDGYARILDILTYLFREVPKRASGPQHPFVKKVLDLGDNFPLCYYAGGSKALLGEPDTSTSSSKPNKLTPGKRQRLEKRLEILQSEWDVRSKKVKRMRNVLAIEVGTAAKFQLEEQLLEEETLASSLEIEIDDIDSLLNL